MCEVQGEVWEMCVLYDEGFASGGVVSCRGGGGAGGGVVEDESDEEEEVVSFFLAFLARSVSGFVFGCWGLGG